MTKKSIITTSVILFFLGSVTMPGSIFGDEKIKWPNVSGQFYSADPKRLSADLDIFFARANVQPSSTLVRIILAPHAGYPYSGGVAAYGYKAAKGHAYKTIVILAPSHFYGFDGISIWPEGAFQTPLGEIPVDEKFAKELSAGSPDFYFDPKAFEREHSLEVELPFLQKTFSGFKIVPVVMGQPSLETLKNFAIFLNKLIGDRQDVLVVVSSDLSHYHDDATARMMDSRTTEAVRQLKSEQVWKENHQRTMEMCGFIPTVAAILLARERGLKEGEILRYANSGDVSGDKNNVVGYSSIVFYEDFAKDDDPQQEEKKNVVGPENDLSLTQKRRLIEIAKDSIKEFVNNARILAVKEDDPRLQKSEGAFVTIKKHGQLRGCKGNILGRGPLYLLVRDMAVSSASEDPRFKAVQKDELNSLEIDISVLSKPKEIKSVDEFVLGLHGVIISQGPFHQGVFLPQVATEFNMTKETFLSELCSQKAGLPLDCWKDPSTQFLVFTAQVFSEKDVE